MFNKLHIICRKQAIASIRCEASPPALVHHLYANYEVVGVKGDLSVVRCEGQGRMELTTLKPRHSVCSSYDWLLLVEPMIVA